MKPAVLIVEDDSKTAELIRLYLDRDGYPVTVARNGREGLELARRNNLGPVLLDVMMPELGTLVAEGQGYVRINEWMVIVPAVAIATLMICFTFLGDGLRDALDPRTRR